MLNEWEKLVSNQNMDIDYLEKLVELEENMQKFSNTMEEKYDSSQIKKLEIKHFPKINTGNIEDLFQIPYPEFKENILLYGVSEVNEGIGRDGIAETALTNKDTPLYADAYIYNMGIDINLDKEYVIKDNVRALIDEVVKSNGQVSEKVKEMLLIKTEQHPADKKLFHSDKVNPTADKELLDILLQNEEYIDALKEIDFIDKKIQSFEKELEKGQSEDVVMNLNFLEEDIFNAFNKLNEIKTITILDKVLKEGGKIYFSLDQIASSIDSTGKLYLDKEKLADILFNPDSDYYNTITSRELRHIHTNYLKNPNLKFLLMRQVIEFPEEFIKNNN